MQAAILRVKLKRLREWTESRRAVARRYIEGLAGLPLRLPDLGRSGSVHTFHLFVLRCERRDALAAHLTRHDIGNAVYYPVPVHRQKPYAAAQLPGESFPHTEEAARTALALPLYPELEPGEVDTVCRAVREFFK